MFGYFFFVSLLLTRMAIWPFPDGCGGRTCENVMESLLRDARPDVWAVAH